MLTFITAALISTLILVNFHLTLILLILLWIGVILTFTKKEISDFYKFTIEDEISETKILLGLLFPCLIMTVFLYFTPSLSYSPKDNPSIKCSTLINHDGVTSLEDCTDNKTYINVQVIGEK